MRRHHAGSGRRRGVPAEWAAAHRSTVAGTRNGTVGLREPGTTQVWSNEDEAMVATPREAYWTGPARIQALGVQGRVVVAVGDAEVVASYLVAVDAAVTATPGHLVDVTASGDPVLDGRSLQVLQVVTGTERFERDLLCTLSS